MMLRRRRLTKIMKRLLAEPREAATDAWLPPLTPPRESHPLRATEGPLLTVEQAEALEALREAAILRAVAAREAADERAEQAAADAFLARIEARESRLRERTLVETVRRAWVSPRPAGSRPDPSSPRPSRPDRGGPRS